MKLLLIPTATYGHPMITPDAAWRFISGQGPRTPMAELGWKSLGVLERWVPWVREADVLLVGGGDALYLHHWMRESGLAEIAGPAYAIDDETAIRVVDGAVDVISEGQWRQFP